MTPSTKLSVSIIIPNFNGKNLLNKHMPDVINASNGAQIIVVDDASTDGSRELIKQSFPNVMLLCLPKNLRFAAACNAGVKKASGEIIVLLNTDVSPKSDFLNYLVKEFADEKVFAVGCREIQTQNGKTTVAGRSGGDFCRGFYRHWRANSQEAEDTLWVSGGSGAFRKSVWNFLGGMDPDFKPAYEEDRDLCYRALKRGYKIVFCPKSEVVHIHETTNLEALGSRNMSLAAHKNNLLFVWKNITDNRLIIKHILWLPYHLILTSIRTRGIFFKAFLKALTVLPSIYQSRQREKAEATVLDKTIITRYAAIK